MKIKKPNFNRLDKQQKVVLVLFIIAGIFAFWASWYTIKNTDFSNFREEKESPPLVDEMGEPTKDFYEAATEKTYEEIKAIAPEVVAQPHISVANRKDSLDEKTKNVDPKNNIVIYTEEVTTFQTAVILQGDIVTWQNDSPTPISLIGENDWRTRLPIQPGRAFSQQFDFLGDYRYYLESNPEVVGVVRVGSSSD